MKLVMSKLKYAFIVLTIVELAVLALTGGLGTLAAPVLLILILLAGFVPKNQKVVGCLLILQLIVFVFFMNSVGVAY